MNFRPRMIRVAASAAMLSLFALNMPSMAQASPVQAPAVVSVQAAVAPSPSADPYTARVLALINEKRAAVGSAPVKWNQSIGNVSQDWAEHLGRATLDPNFDWNKIHRSDAGGSLIPAGATWYRENIAFASTPETIVNWWMGSPGHKAAMLDPRATDIGIGYVVPASGPYSGWHQVVTNLAAYPNSTTSPTPVAPPVALPAKALNAVDTAGNLWAYSAPGNGTIGSRAYLGSGWSSAKQVISADWNSDGILDIVARWGNGYITMYAGLGNSTYRAPINIGSGGWQNYDINAVKLKKTDKYPGLVARDIDSGNLFYYPNTTGGAMTAPRTQIGFGGWTPMTEISAHDWDADGNMDLIVRNPAGELKLYRTDGAGNILHEGRRTVDFGWNVMNHLAIEHNFAGAGSVGFIARDWNGYLHYYPISNGKVQPRVTIGFGGWTGYNLSAGTP